MTTAMRFLTIAIALALALVRPGWALQQAPALVSIDVAVTYPKGESVDRLTKDDFTVMVDGKPAAIEGFVAPPVPVTVVFLIDVSASMVRFYGIGDELREILPVVLHAGDRGRVGAIANRVVLAPRFANGRDAVSDARKVLSVDFRDTLGPSPAWDAIDGATTALRTETGRRGIVLVTDGKSTGNRLGLVEVIERAVFEGIVVQTLTEARPYAVSQGGNVAARVRAELALQELAQFTGGLCLPEGFGPNDVQPDARTGISRLMRDLRGMYTLQVAPEGSPGSLHKLQVIVKRGNVSVRARAAYRTPAAQ